MTAWVNPRREYTGEWRDRIVAELAERKAPLVIDPEFSDDDAEAEYDDTLAALEHAGVYDWEFAGLYEWERRLERDLVDAAREAAAFDDYLLGSAPPTSPVFGDVFDPADVQWGFCVRTRP